LWDVRAIIAEEIVDRTGSRSNTAKKIPMVKRSGDTLQTVESTSNTQAEHRNAHKVFRKRKETRVT